MNMTHECSRIRASARPSFSFKAALTFLVKWGTKSSEGSLEVSFPRLTCANNRSHRDKHTVIIACYTKNCSASIDRGIAGYGYATGD